MEKTIGKKIEELRESAGWSQKALGDKIGRTQQAVAQYESGVRYPRAVLRKLADAFGLPVSYFVDDAAIKTPSSPLPAIRIITPYSFEPDVIHEKAVDYSAVPVYEAAVVGGPPEEVHSERAKTVAFIPSKAMKGRDPQHVACFEVKGESMDPIIRPGALVAVDLSIRPERAGTGHAETKRKGIWIVKCKGGLCIKHIQIKDGVIVLVSANPAEGVEVVTDPEAIVGKVFFVAQGL